MVSVIEIAARMGVAPITLIRAKEAGALWAWARRHGARDRPDGSWICPDGAIVDSPAAAKTHIHALDGRLGRLRAATERPAPVDRKQFYKNLADRRRDNPQSAVEKGS